MCSHPEDRSGISHVLSSSPPPTCLSIPLPDDGWQRPLSLPRTALKATVRVLAGGSEVLGSSFITSSSLPPALSTAGSESAPGQRKKPEGQGAVRECSKVAVWQTGFPLRAKGPICTGHLSLLAPKNWWNFPPPPPPPVFWSQPRGSVCRHAHHTCGLFGAWGQTWAFSSVSTSTGPGEGVLAALHSPHLWGRPSHAPASEPAGVPSLDHR